LPILVDDIGPIGDQAAGGDEIAFVIDRGQFVPGRQRDDQIAMKRRRAAAPPFSATTMSAASTTKRATINRARGRLSSPEILEPIRGQLGIAHRVLDVLVAEPCLQRPCVVAGVG
jgi:hypothetical protein